MKFQSESDSSSVISSSDNEYSSSADESDTESSNSPSESLDVTEGIDSQDTYILNDTCVEELQSVDTQSNVKEGSREKLSVNTSGLEDFNKKMEVTPEITGSTAPELDQETPISETLSGAEFTKSDKKESVTDSDKSGMDATGLSVESEGASVNVHDDNIPQVDNTVGISEADMLDIIDKLTKEDDTVEQSPEYESDLLFGNLNENKGARDSEFDKFVRGEAPSFDSISPVVSDNEECESLDSKSSSNHSNLDSDNSCTDSDVSCDEAVVGTWSPSPLYSETFGNFEEEDQDETAMDVEEQKTDVLAGYEFAGTSNISEGSEAVQQDTELSSLRADVKGLMEEMEAIVQDTEKGDTEKSGEFIRAVVTDIDNSVRMSGDEIIVPEVISKSEPLASIMASGTRERSRTPEGELLHVKFQTPTNTLFYDPECPIVEKVAVEVSDDLIDYDEEQEGLEGTSEEQVGNVVDEDLESKVVEDLKDVYDNLEAQGKIEGAMDLIKDSGITNMNDIALQFAKDVLEQARNERLSRETSKAEIDQKDDIESEKLRQITFEKSQQYAPERDRTKIPFNNNEETVIPEEKQTVSVGPFKDYIEKETVEPVEMLSYGLKPESHFCQDTISEKEATNVTEEMLKESTVSGLEENESIGEKENENINEEPVVLRRKKVNKVESEMSERNEVESMIIHDVELPPERDIQSMIIHDNVECKLHDVLSSFTRNQDEESSDEKCEEIGIKSSETEHFKVGLDELEVRHLRRLSSASSEEHGHVTNMVNESKVNLEKNIEHEGPDVFSKKSEDEHVDLSHEIKSRNIDTKISESSENMNIQKEEKERQDLSFSARTAELMQSVYREGSYKNMFIFQLCFCLFLTCYW